MRVYGGLPKSWLEARWPDDAGPPVLPLPFFLPRRVEASPPARRGEEKKRGAGMLVNWLTPRAGEKSSQPQQRLRAERGWRHQWDYTTPTRPGLHRPWSSGFSPASVVGTCSRISWSSSRVERRLVQMVSIRAPVSDAVTPPLQRIACMKCFWEKCERFSRKEARRTERPSEAIVALALRAVTASSRSAATMRNYQLHFNAFFLLR